ncbi:MAG: CopD family protein [Noviherbaspirillum sp.]
MEAMPAQTAATVLINASLAWIAGVLASRLWLLHQNAQWQKIAVERLSPAMATGLLACAAGLFLSLWTESAAMGDVAWLDAWPAFTQMLGSTHYGRAGAAAAALLAAAMLAHWRLRGAAAGLGYVGSITLLLLLVFAARVAIGHAYEHGPLSVAVLVEWLHLLFMSLWTGIVFAAGWLVLPHALAHEASPTRERAAYLGSMSRWATAALAGILATGAYNAWRVLGSPRELIDADYGRVVLAKLCLVAAAMALGSFNRFHGLPAALAPHAAPGKAQRALGTVIAVLRVESLVLLLVLAAAALLTNSAPHG